MFFNAFLLSFYTVMAFTEHQPCLTATGSNVTQGFDFAFKLGFCGVAADFLNAAFFEIYIRLRKQDEMEKRGYVSSMTCTLQTIYIAMEWAFRAVTLTVSLL